jgi:hypothetical protein
LTACQPGKPQFRGIDITGADYAKDFALTDFNGRPRTLQDFKGKAVVMFFAFSCLFTLSPQNMADAKAQNIPVLSYLANHFASMSGTKSTFASSIP